MTKWFTADLHLGHDMVAEYRGFKTTHKHDTEVTARYNAKVQEDDEVWIVGDLCMWGPQNTNSVEQIIRKLNGQKHLILGNHDKLKPFDYVEMGIVSVHTALQVTLGASVVTNIVHDPAVVTVDPSMHWICGHVHDLFLQIGTCLNVGLDVWGLEPVPWPTALEMLIDAEPTPDQRNTTWLSEHRHDRVSDTDWPFCSTCRSYHHPDNPTCKLKEAGSTPS
jgi:calcineurin-like phosphoesterase family protein